MLIAPFFQATGAVRPRQVLQDDEDLQPRQGLQEEQQVWLLLNREKIFEILKYFKTSTNNQALMQRLYVPPSPRKVDKKTKYNKPPQRNLKAAKII